ncbi:3-hydroxyisobutyrate dehydrogenase-like beta-hydroxyacid dehydrogenase [Saccharothrix australiensis]|uniref:3-hydroxyisobutyrate dehydrogenase-like beta-hydroxyacid dehydrogenase n=1 Tax=Saccharothrix australiensis TaxID=2072 RepID=A0A495VVK2_9PSEU|nr:3-hydroxyisobutyrate dehydrogenase-like beta-hydroxyacid dehydrogenase [Saccharothrix australiensis]
MTVLGLGLMGAALAAAFHRAGHPTTVWTRSDRPGPDGTVRAATAAGAVAASPLVVVCVLDYRAAERVLDGDLEGRTVVNLTTGTPEQARELAARVAGRGGAYLDGAILANPSGVGSPATPVFHSGPPEVFRAHERTLAALGACTHLGADVGLAALYDTALLGIVYPAVTGYLQALALLGREGVSAAEFTPLAQGVLAAFPALLPAMAAQVDSGDYVTGEARLDMQVAAVEPLIEGGRARGVDTGLLEHVRSLMARAVAAGHGAADYSAVVEVLRAP